MLIFSGIMVNAGLLVFSMISKIGFSPPFESIKKNSLLAFTSPRENVVLTFSSGWVLFKAAF